MTKIETLKKEIANLASDEKSPLPTGMSKELKNY